MKPSYLLCAVLLLSMAGCDKTDNSREAAFDEFFVTMRDAFGVFTDLSIEVQSSQQAAKGRPIYNCPNTGTVEYELTDVSETNVFTYNMMFLGCEQASGTITYAIASEQTETNFDLDFVVNGRLNSTCDIQYSAFGQEVAANLQTDPPVFNFTLNGGITGTCGDHVFTCSFVDNTFDTSNTDVFAEQCG